MAKDFGIGVSRTLDAYQRQFRHVVWQKGRPPLDSELSLQDDIWSEKNREGVKVVMPSGFLMDPTRALQDFQTNVYWANMLKFGTPRLPYGVGEGPEKTPVVWANVNGWVIPVCGTDTIEGDLANILRLSPPPSTNARVDFVFLEAWLARVDANPSVVNKPGVSTLYKYGNVLYGGTNITDDLEDPTLGFATTARTQVQYRLRVHDNTSVDLAQYPEGLGDPVLLGQGTATIPVGGLTFTNMREELGDTGLWRAGDGNPNNALGTIDGYTYAIPVCALFRRSSDSYVAVNTGGSPNHTGGFCRTPDSSALPDPRAGARELLVASLTNALTATDGIGADVTIQITNLNGCGLEDGHILANIHLVIGDEVVSISAKDLVAGTITIPAGGRGRFGTAIVGHPAGATLQFFNLRSDGLYSDQITSSDIHDMRHAINDMDWDYKRLLEHNLVSLLRGDLQTTWKNAALGNSVGKVTHEISYLWADGTTPVPNGTEALDGPDGIRTVWSDAAVIQPGVTILLDNTSVQVNGYVDSFMTGGGYAWDVGAALLPGGFMNVFGEVDTEAFCNGTSIFLYTGGADGNGGARATFRDADTKAVRMVSPKEYWRGTFSYDLEQGLQFPFSLRFLDQRANEPAPPSLNASWVGRHVGSFMPDPTTNFETPFIVLGGLLKTGFTATVPATALTTPLYAEIDVGIDFDVRGSFYTLNPDTGGMADDPTAVANPMLHGRRTLASMLTHGFTDGSGRNTEVYVVVHGDTASRNNNGAFKVMGAGTVGYTAVSASNATSIVVQALSADFVTFDSGTGNQVTVEFRSQEIDSEDDSSYNDGVPDVVVVLTDIGGHLPGAFERSRLGYGAGDGYDLSLPDGTLPTFTAVPSKAVLDFTLLYHPGRGGLARVPDTITRFAMKGGTTDLNGAYLRQSPNEVDVTFTPSDEAFWDPAHIQLWNRLPSLGWPAPLAPSYGGVVVGQMEQDREHELFFDNGSKTLLFRPFRDRRMTLQELSWVDVSTPIPANRCLFGEYGYVGGAVYKDCLRMFTGGAPDQATTGKKMGFVIPWEFMPRFGRQDIPYYKDMTGGTGAFLSGINHLFRDESSFASPVFNIVGGEPTSVGVPAVKPLFFVTGGATVPATTYGAANVLPPGMGSYPFIQARRAPLDIASAVPFAPEIIKSLARVASSDFGKGLRGIQLPPYYGIARLYGIYDSRDFETAGGMSFQPDRMTPIVGGAPNLLREDVDQQTLFILQGGGKDYGGDDGDHTYVIPYNVLDITRAWNYMDGDVPDDYHYVVECVVFGFARGFIDQNNYVVVRKYNGLGAGVGGIVENTDGDDLEIEGLHMVIPCPAAINDQFYTAYDRTVYQGDSYGTQNGGYDYENRYGQLSPLAQWSLHTPIQQYDASGTFMPEIPNAKAFEVLSALDFHTTMGTGKIGGLLLPGTPLDIGYTEDTADSAERDLTSSTATPWRIQTRAFTESQKDTPNNASLDFVIVNNDYLDMMDTGDMSTLNDRAWISFDIPTETGVKRESLYFTKDGASRAAYSGAYPSRQLVLVDQTDQPTILTSSYTYANPTLLAPGETLLVTTTVTGAVVGDTVLLDQPSPNNTDTVFMGTVSAPDTVTIYAINTWTPAAYLRGSDAIQADVIVNLVADVNPGDSFEVTNVSFPGAVLANNQSVLVTYAATASEDGLIFTGEVTADARLSIWVHNPTTGALGAGNKTVRCTLFDSAAHVYADHVDILNTFALGIKVLHSNPVGIASKTLRNLQTVIANNGTLSNAFLTRIYDDNVMHIYSRTPGAKGNLNKATVFHGFYSLLASSVLRLERPGQYLLQRSLVLPQSTYFTGGEDLPLNAGTGTSQIHLGGMIERLPLGALLQDSDFICENPLGDTVSAVQVTQAVLNPVQTLLPLTATGGEYTRFFGEPGALVALADGYNAITSFGAWRSVGEGGGGPGYTKSFRTYRGGSAFTLSGDDPGAPIDWASNTFPSSVKPVLKGGILAGKALLVRSFREDANGATKVSDGDEIQMLIFTQGVLGTGQTQAEGINVQGLISPTGYGEGWSAADRFRLNGKPLFRGYSRAVPDPSTVNLVVYPDEI